MEITNVVKIVIAYATGQITQLVLHAMVLNWNMWISEQIPLCMAGGFVILFALVVSIKIATPKQKGEHKKSYLEWAKVPGKKDERRTSEMDEGF